MPGGSPELHLRSLHLACHLPWCLASTLSYHHSFVDNFFYYSFDFYSGDDSDAKRGKPVVNGYSTSRGRRNCRRCYWRTGPVMHHGGRLGMVPSQPTFTEKLEKSEHLFGFVQQYNLADVVGSVLTIFSRSRLHGATSSSLRTPSRTQPHSHQTQPVQNHESFASKQGWYSCYRI